MEKAGAAADSKLFEQLTRELLERGIGVRFQARGASMSPAIRDGEIVQITPVIVSKLRKDDIVLAKSNDGFRLHRIVFADHAHDVFVTRGDCGQQNDPALAGAEILGLAQAKEVRVGHIRVDAKFRGIEGCALRCVARGQAAARKILRRVVAQAVATRLFAVLAVIFLASIFAAAQVAVDSTSSAQASFNTTGANALTFAHTTTTTANRLLLVGVSMNISSVNTTTVTGVTYNGTALTSAGAHNDAGNTRRVEMWYLLAPASGTQNVVVTVNLPSSGTVGVVAGATTFTDVDQTVPLGTFVSADGANGANSQLDVPSVVNGMLLDTLATGGNQTITVPGPQVTQWNQNTGTSGTDVAASGTSRTGAPSVPVAETFSGTSNWSLGAISVNPSTADIAVTTSVNAVALGQNSTYNITVTNNGPSAANNVTLTDTFAATNLSLVSFTPSAGVSCTQTTTINCTLPTPFASGATATLTVEVAASAAGYYPNTATITDSGTPPDPNTGNNSYVALAPVLTVICSNNVPAAGGTLKNVINTYYPGTASVAAGATSIPIGAANGTGTIANGSLLLVIQMQNASISTSNNVNYGNGSTGSGFTAIDNAGNYEFVTATGAESGGSVPISGAGAGGGLVFGYTASAATATQGQSTYQVVLVPQYSSATLSSSLTAATWNGATGGILALDVSGQLNLGGATVVVDGMGFRGAAGLQLGGGGGSNTDYQQPSPATYTASGNSTPDQVGWDASKGEGIAGTPMWVESNANVLQTTTTVGYPSGTSGIDGSMARGAPGNAGGGGTDGDPQTAFPYGNDQNDGGGGGGNGGSGGFGGDSWNTNLSLGGEGGAAFPETIDRIAMGGGGGAGTRNNSGPDTQASSGSAGGGIIFIRADSLTGTATLTANGVNSYNATANDAGGGGGAGGTIVILSANGGEGGLTLDANGGNGGNAWESEAYALTQRHGPGGGGGGGVIFVSGAPAGVSVAGGANGLTLNPGVAYGSTSGNTGTNVTNATLSQVTGVQSSAVCSQALLKISKTHGGGSLTRGGTATYTIQVSNISPLGSTTGVVTVNDTLPTGLTPTAASGTGWTCSISGQTVSCTESTALGPNSSYSAITVTATVLQTAPAIVVNTAVVSGGGDLDTLDDTATDTASVISSADLSVTDAGSPNPVTAGSNITYTQIVTNNGPSAADNATLVSTIPANTTFVSIVAPAGWSCITPGAGGTGNVVCSNVGIPDLASGTFTLVVKVASTTANGTVITEMDSVSSSVSDPNPGNNTASVSTEVGTTTNGELTVSNVASPNPIQASNDITYTQVVTNSGSSAATTATFSENTPANTKLVSITPASGWSCTTFPPQCTNPSVAAGSSGTFTVVYQVNAGTAAGTPISDTVTVNAANQAFGANSATASDVVASSTQADLALSTVATPATVLAGNNITYTQTITNNGPATASGVSLTEATPTNTTFQSVLAPTGWTCTAPAVGSTGNVNCTDSTLASGTAADIIVVVNVPASLSFSTITANSSVTATTSDPNPANNSTTVVTSVGVDCDLAVTNVGTPSPVAAGNDITYTQVVTNSGPSNCSAGTLMEATPANTTFVSVSATTSGGGTWTCPNSAPVSCTNPGVPPGSIGTITAVYQVVSGTSAGTIITDTVNVNSSTGDTNRANNSATSTIAVASSTQADLSLTNSASPNPVSAGGNITYTQTVTNNGPGPSSGVVLTETLPANTTFVSLGGSSWNCTTTAPYTCTDTTSLAANTSASFSFVVTVNSTVTAGSTITDTASVSSSTTDPNPGNNSASVTVYVADSADLSVTNSLPTTSIPAEDSSVLVYTQVVKNGGPSTATNVTLTETLPTQTTANSLTTGATGWTCTVATLTCSNPSLAPNASATVTFTVTVSATAPAGTTLNQTASVSSNTSDPNTANNTATVTDVVASSSEADLVVTNSALPSPTVAAGGTITYTQTVQNLGPHSTGAGATFTQVTPPNTTFVSIATSGPTGGWTCGTKPAVGGTGTITCTHGGTFASGGDTTFSLEVQVNAQTPSGTSITDTATANASNLVPNLTTNTASATVIVANANSADMAIVKTATPNPVTEGTPLTYMLSVTNNGPATATDVIVADTLPSAMTYLSASSTQGSCSEADGTVTCLLGTMDNSVTATVTILTIPEQPGRVSNTATVQADQTDPNEANNSSTQTESVAYPTAITLQSFSAHIGTDKNGATRALLTWKTGGEAHNLGFNLYREQNGNRVRLNSSLIAGSALLMSGALPKHAARSYAWIDPFAAGSASSYWLEDVDTNGVRTMHGPIALEIGQSDSDESTAETRMLSQLSQAQPAVPGTHQSHTVEAVAMNSAVTPVQISKQFELAADRAIKIFVQHEGWYRITQPDLIKAGLDPNVDPARLHLYAEAIEQPIEITGVTPGPGGFGPQAAISFYGTGINTVFSGTRVYWLVSCESRASRIPNLPLSSGSNQPPASYLATVELQQHTIYFGALLTKDGNNFFGALVSPTPVEQTLYVPHFDSTSTQDASIDVLLQGIIVGYPHEVSVTLNGTSIGEVTFTGQDKGRLRVQVPPGLLQEGNNTVTLTAQNGEYDTSLVQYIRITYPHKYVADSDELRFTGRAGDEIAASGFSSAPVVLDITDPEAPVQLTPTFNVNNSNYEIAVQVPWTTTNPSNPIRHTLLAVANDRVASPAAIQPNHPSHWHIAQRGADIAMVTYDSFAGALAQLAHIHEEHGKSSVTVPVTALYDEFNFGEHSPAAIREFLQTATRNWDRAPSYLLLNGRASFDPRNYLGMGQLDLVPTEILAATGLMTASDDWFSDFSDKGVATIATGRLPAGTLEEDEQVIEKIVGYEHRSDIESWTSHALIVADRDDSESFTKDSQTVQAQLPHSMQATDVFAGILGATAAREDIVQGINSGQLLVNYLGHGSEEQWSGLDILDTNIVDSLTNGSQLPVFLIMDCLNGFFQDVYSQPLGVSLLLAPNGGAVAVLASSGLNQPLPQVRLDKFVVENAFNPPYLTLGESILKAKAQIQDEDVRRTFVLFGDPAMQVKQPSAGSSRH